MQPDSIPPPDYDAIERAVWRENAGHVLSMLDINDSDLVKKIETFSARHGYGADIVKEKIRIDPLFAAHFAKEPRRQGLHEREAANWLLALDSIEGFSKLPKAGRNALYITSDGEVKYGVELQAKTSKSLDFRWNTGTTTCYAMHKYTREVGGNQDSQFKEMRELLQQFMRCPDETCILLIIVDGPYYTSQRVSDLRHFTRSHPPKSYVVHIQDVPEVLREYCQP